MANKTPPTETISPLGDTKPAGGETPSAPAEAKPAKPEPPQGPERLTPHAWGEQLGLCEKADPARPWIESHADWRFAAADKLHGWSDHAHHWQGPGQELLLTKEEFEAALQAGADYPEKPAHRPACGKGFEDRALTKEQLEAKAKEAAKAAEVKTNG